MLRADKSTPDKNAVRTLMAGLAIALVIFLGFDPARRLYEHHVLDEPWMESSIVLVPSSDGYPDILHQADLRTTIHTDTRVWSESATGRLLCRVDGSRTFGAGQVNELWSWNALLGVCQVPDEEFRICVRYSIAAPLWARDVIGPFCSDLFTRNDGGL